MDMWERWWEMYEQENECYASFAKDAESEAPLPYGSRWSLEVLALSLREIGGV